MAFNGSGLFARLFSWQNDAANSINIRADRMDAEMDGIASGLSNCITRDGQGKPSAAIDWNGQNLSNVNTLAATSATLTNAPDAADNSSKVPTTAWVLANTAGKLINVQTFTSSGTYTPTAGTKSVIVEVQGGGGSGGGTPATSSGAISIGAGGTAGAYAKSLITSGFAGVAVTVGGGGAAVSGFGSNTGGTSSFGALVSAPGGYGGNSAGPTLPPYVVGSLQSAPATGGNIVNSCGTSGGTAYASDAAGLGMSAMGGSSVFGGGGAYVGAGINGAAASTRGAGGGGTYAPQNTGSRAGGAGAPGVVIIYELA